MAGQTIAGRVLVYGGKGALGSTVVSYFKTRDWWVGSIDMLRNDEANANVLLEKGNAWQQQEKDVVSGIQDILNDEKLDAIICVAGGWAGGNAASRSFLDNCDLTWKQSVWTSVISARLAAEYLKENGLVTFTGAKAALSGTPGMIGYGMSKAAVHHLVQSLAAEGSGLPDNSVAVAILPSVLDTPANRKMMSAEDVNTWTPLEFVAELLYKWSTGVDRPKTGSLVQLITKNFETELEVV